MCMYILFHNKIFKKMRKEVSKVMSKNNYTNFFFFFLMNGEVRLSAGGLYSLRARKAKYPRYRYIRLERHIRLNISRPSFKSRRREQKNNNIRPIYANWFYEMSFKSTSLVISGWWQSLAIKPTHTPNFYVSHRRNKMSFFRN